MKRSLSKEHLTADSCQPRSPYTPRNQDQYQLNIPVDENRVVSPRINQNHNQSQRIPAWHLILIMSSLFANGLAAASIYYLWQFCD